MALAPRRATSRDGCARRTPTLWGAGRARLRSPTASGWLTIAERMLETLDELERVRRADVRREGYTDVVLLGMGGSSLAPEVLRRCLPPPTPAARALHVLDSTDAAAILAVRQAVDPERTLFIVSSKSGGTIEPLSLFAHFYSLVRDGVAASSRSPTPGRASASSRRRARLPPRRSSATRTSAGATAPCRRSGSCPAALMGVDARALLRGCGRGLGDPAWTPARPRGHPGAGLARRRASALAQAGRDKLTFVIAPSLPGLGLWLEQLVAESTGKHGTGILPVAEEPLGEPDATTARTACSPTCRTSPSAGADARGAASQALGARGAPADHDPDAAGPPISGACSCSPSSPSPSPAGGFEINPFDQPNVQQAKDATKRVLAGYEAERRAARRCPHADEAALRELLLGAAPPDYVAMMAYAAALDRASTRRSPSCARRSAQPTRATTTFGYGPRFLHSTGPVPQGRPEDRALPAAAPRRARAMSRSRARRTRSRRSRTPRRSAT